MKGIRTLVLIFAVLAGLGLIIFRFVKKPLSGIPTQNSTPVTRNAFSNSASKIKTSGNIDYSKGERPATPLPGQVFFEDSGFNPATISAQVGQIVTFFNFSKKQLTLVGYKIPSVNIAENQNATVQFQEAGKFEYQNSVDKKRVLVIVN